MFLPALFERYHCCSTVIVDWTCPDLFSILPTLHTDCTGPWRLPVTFISTLNAFPGFLLPFLLFLVLLLLHHNCYEFQRTFFTLSCFSPYIPFLQLLYVATQPTLIKVFLGAKCSSLKVAGPPFAVQNTGPAPLFVWITQCLPKDIFL